MLGVDLRTSKRFRRIPRGVSSHTAGGRELTGTPTVRCHRKPGRAVRFQGTGTARLLALACAVPSPGAPASSPSSEACTGTLQADVSLPGVGPMVPAELSLTVVVGTTQTAFESHVQNHQPSAGPGSPRKASGSPPPSPGHRGQAGGRAGRGATCRKPGVYIASRD